MEHLLQKHCSIKYCNVLRMLTLCLFLVGSSGGQILQASVPEPEAGSAAKTMQISVSGKVVDSQTNEGLPGANVVVQGTTQGTVTNLEGEFTIEVPDPEAVLVISYVGYRTVEVPVQNRTQIEIALEPEAEVLEEIVVVGYGTQEKKTLTGSVASTTGDDIMEAPITNVSNSLAGRVPGLFVTTPSGEPGRDGSTIRIRGVSTFNNSEPLVVVDGVPGRSLDRIDPSTIDNISVLKDASAAIYGAQAANGVILITTKRGKVGKPTVNFTYNEGRGQPTTLPEMTNAFEYATMLNEVDYYNGVPNRFTADQLQKYKDGSDPLNYPNTDWYETVMRKWSPQRFANLNVSGGSENFAYFISGSTKFQDAYYEKSANYYKQHDLRANLDGNITQHIKLSFDIAGRMQDLNAPRSGSSGIFQSLSRSKPTDIAFWPTGEPGPAVEGGGNPAVEVTDAMGYRYEKDYSLSSNLSLNVDLPWVEGLSFKLLAAIDYGFGFDKSWRIPWNLWSWDGTTLDANGNPLLTMATWGSDPNLSQTDSRSDNFLTSAIINYRRVFAQNHSVTLLGGVEKITGHSEYLYGYRRYYISSALDELSAGGMDQRQNDGSSFETARLNYFGRVNYGFKSRYLVEFQWRYQGSYIFTKENRFGFFPGVSLGYVISEEDFWQNSLGNAISFFKIRGSYGATGNDLIDPYQYLASYTIGTLNTMTNGGAVAEQALFEDVVPNPNATWESAIQKNIGVDMRFLGGALSVTADYFMNTREDILATRNASVPVSTGLVLPDENIGKAENNGFDFVISYQNNPNVNEFTYQISVNGVYSNNKLVYWDEVPGVPDYQLAEGAPLFADLYYESIGIFRDQTAVDAYPHWDGARPGDVIFKDVSEDGVIDANDKVRRDKTHIPKFTGGLSVHMRYKGFDFSALLQGAAGAERYIFGYAGEIGNYFKEYYDNRWTEANPTASMPRTFNREDAYWACSDDYSTQSTHFLQKTDYIRLKNLEIGYRLPSNISQRVMMENVRVYLSGFNLFTIAPDLKGFDPEMQQARGYGYPLQRVINIGVNIQF